MKPWVERAHALIHPAYCAGKNYGIREEELAGLISVECARLDPKASRFEPHVHADILKALYGQTPRNHPGFMNQKFRAFIQGASVEERRALASSYGLGQIMGYHYFLKWGLKPAQFTNLTVEESVRYTLRMMAEGQGWAVKFIKSQQKQEWGRVYEFMLRWWNTGSVHGKTYHPDYVANATKMRDNYRRLLDGKKQV